MRAGSKSIGTCTVLLIWLSLALTPGSGYALPSAVSTAEINWGSLEIITDGLTITYHDQYVTYDDNKHVSYSEAYVRSNTADDYDIDRKATGTWSDTNADVGITGATAKAQTSGDKLYGSVSADANDFISESRARATADAERWVYFDVKGTGTITLTADYYLNLDIGVDTVNDYAYAYSDAWLALKNKTTPRYVEDWLWIESELQDTIGEKQDEDQGKLEISLNYNNGDYGYMWMGVYNKVKVKTETPVSPVPEPATMLLLGSGLVCLAGFRRKFRSN